MNVLPFTLCMVKFILFYFTVLLCLILLYCITVGNHVTVIKRNRNTNTNTRKFVFLLMTVTWLPTVIKYKRNIHIQPHIDIHMHVHSVTVALASAWIEAPLLRRAITTSAWSLYAANMRAVQVMWYECKRWLKHIVIQDSVLSISNEIKWNKMKGDEMKWNEMRWHIMELAVLCHDIFDLTFTFIWKRLDFSLLGWISRWCRYC